MVKFLLNAPAALIESITGQAHNVERIHDRPRVWELFGGGALKAGESIHRDDLNALAPGVGLGGQPGFENPLGSARNHIQEPGGTTTVTYRSQVQDDGDVPVPIRGVAPLAGYVSQAPDYRAARNALAPAASTPLVLTSNTARQHCMVWLRCADSSPPTPDHQGA